MLSKNKIFFKKTNFYVLYLIVAIIPFVNRAYHYHLPKNLYSYFGKNQIDFLTYYKGKVLIILTVVLICFFIGGLVKKEYRLKKNTKLYIPLGIYGLFIFLSTIYSQFPEVAYWGLINRNEGLFVSISYLAIFFITYNIIQGKEDIKRILYVILGVNIVLGIIGLLDFYGFTFTSFEFITKMIIPDSLESIIQGFGTQYSKGYIASFWGNPNYVGSFGAIMFSLSFILYFYRKYDKKLIFASTVLSFILLIGSISRAGMLGTIVSLSLFLLINLKAVLNNKDIQKRLLIIFLVLTAIFIPMNKYSNGGISSDINSLGKEAETGLLKGESKYWIDDLEIKDKEIYIKTDYNEMRINWLKQMPEFKINGEKLSYQIKEGNVVFDKNIEFSSFKYDGILYWFNENLNVRVKFIKTKDYILMSGNNQSYSIIEKPETMFFKGKETLASKRGYIWSRSIPLLYNESLLLGTGPDTFVYYFPQNDFLGKLQIMNRTNHVFQKPHNMYLQIGIQYGVLALIAFMFILGLYYKETFKEIIDKNNYSKINIAIAFSLLSYLLAGLFNDTVIINSIYFWIMLALAYSKIDR